MQNCYRAPINAVKSIDLIKNIQATACIERNSTICRMNGLILDRTILIDEKQFFPPWRTLSLWRYIDKSLTFYLDPDFLYS